MRDEIDKLLAAALPGVQLSPAHWRSVLPLCRVQKLSRGGVLLAQGQPTPALYGLLAGEMEVRFTTADGDVSVIDHLTPGRLFGLSSFVTGQPSTFEALALRATRVVAFGPSAYAELMDQVPGFARALMLRFAQSHASTLRLLEASRHRGALGRFSMALEQLARAGRGGETDADGWRFVRGTQAELAAQAGLSRQTVNTLIGELAAQGRLRTAYGGLWMPPA